MPNCQLYRYLFTGVVLFFGGSAVTMALLINLSTNWCNILNKWEQVEGYFGHQKNLKLKFTLISIVCIIFSMGKVLYSSAFSDKCFTWWPLTQHWPYTYLITIKKLSLIIGKYNFTKAHNNCWFELQWNIAATCWQVSLRRNGRILTKCSKFTSWKCSLKYLL